MLALAFLLPVWAPLLAAQTASDESLSATVPLRLDYPLLERLLVTQLFQGAGNSRELLNDPTGCSRIRAAAPQLAGDGGQLQLLADLDATVGVGGSGSCATMLRWRGRIGISGDPQIGSDGMSLAFTPRQVWLMDASGQRVNNPALQSLADAGVKQVFEAFEVDLRPQLASVGDFLPEVLPKHSQQQIQALADSLRINAISIDEQAVDAQISLSVPAVSGVAPDETALTDTELAELEERWQLMDSLLVLTVKHYAAATQLQELRDALLEALIESRYRLGDALTDSPDSQTDAVREWFLGSWGRLTPALRQIGMEQSGQEHLLLLSVLTATDALEALDKLGPGIGLEISNDGLRRLARMINGGAADELLDYTGEVDPVLRGLFEDSLGSTAVPTAGDWSRDWQLSLFPRAFAAGPDRLNSWAPKRGDLPEYLPMVGTLLANNAARTADKRKLDTEYRELFRRLVLTTAWQESCWRHYVVSDDRKRHRTY